MATEPTKLHEKKLLVLLVDFVANFGTRLKITHDT